MRVLFVNQEIEPFVVGTQMAMLGKRFPQQAQSLGHEVRIFMPKFGVINERRNQLHEVIRLSGLNLVIRNEDYPLVIKVASLPSIRLQVYFIDNEDFFIRRGIFHDDQGDPYEDNDRRCYFFARGVLETVKKLHWSPDLVHCNGWFTSFVPLLLRGAYSHDAMFSKARILYSLYGDTLDDSLGDSFAQVMQLVKLPGMDFDGVERATLRELSQLAVDHSDAIGLGDTSVDEGLVSYARKAGKPVYECEGVGALEEVYGHLDLEDDDREGWGARLR